MTTDEFPDEFEDEDSPRHRRIMEAMRERTADVVGQAREAAGTAAGAAGGASKGAAGSAGSALSDLSQRFKSAGSELKRASREAEDELWADYMRKTGRDRRDDT